MSDDVRARIGKMRALSTNPEVRHDGLCSKLIDQAECDCYVSTYAAWADHIEEALDE